MSTAQTIPRYALFGETSAFPDLLHVERFRDRAADYGWQIDPHRHDEITQVFLMIDGQCDARVDAQSLSFSKGDFLYIPARAVHEFAFQPHADGFVLSFPAPLMQSLFQTSQDIADILARVHHGRQSPAISAMVDQLHQAHRQPSRFRSARLTSLAHLLLAEIAETALKSDPAGPAADAPAAKLQALDQLIQDHLLEGWQVQKYAQSLSITSGQLSRICRAATGAGAQAYIEAAIMAEAARLLAFTQIPISDIAFQTGFVDPAYFSRRFRKIQGVTPTQYRKQFIDR